MCKNKIVDTFARLRNELTVAKVQHGEILLHDNRLVIPKELQSRVIRIAHQSHIGIVKTNNCCEKRYIFQESIGKSKNCDKSRFLSR